MRLKFQDAIKQTGRERRYGTVAHKLSWFRTNSSTTLFFTCFRLKICNNKNRFFENVTQVNLLKHAFILFPEVVAPNPNRQLSLQYYWYQLILQRHRSHMTGEKDLSENYVALTKGRSTVNAIHAVMDIAAKARKGVVERKRFCALISIDIYNSFNTVRWESCIQAMIRKKVPDYLLQMLDDYPSNRWVIYEGIKWSPNERWHVAPLEVCGLSHSCETSCITIFCTWT